MTTRTIGLSRTGTVPQSTLRLQYRWMGDVSVFRYYQDYSTVGWAMYRYFNTYHDNNDDMHGNSLTINSYLSFILAGEILFYT